jgi:hypothetical protein
LYDVDRTERNYQQDGRGAYADQEFETIYHRWIPQSLRCVMGSRAPPQKGV